MTLRRGHRGDEVVTWQRQLIRAGYSLEPYGADGDFGMLTELRTFQATGSVVVDAQAALAPLPEGLEGVTFVRARHFTPSSRTRIPLVVIHTAEVAEGSLSAEAVARFFATTDRKASAHVCVDDTTLVECVMPASVAWAAPGANRHGYHYELSGYARQSAAEWLDPFSRKMLDHAAWHAARQALRYRVPLRWLDDGDFADFVRDPSCHPGGFTSHAVSARVGRNWQKWGLPKPRRTSDHWDPGPHFPAERFLELVAAEQTRLESRSCG